MTFGDERKKVFVWKFTDSQWSTSDPQKLINWSKYENFTKKTTNTSFVLSEEKMIFLFEQNDTIEIQVKYLLPPNTDWAMPKVASEIRSSGKLDLGRFHALRVQTAQDDMKCVAIYTIPIYHWHPVSVCVCVCVYVRSPKPEIVQRKRFYFDCLSGWNAAAANQKWRCAGAHSIAEYLQCSRPIVFAMCSNACAWNACTSKMHMHMHTHSHTHTHCTCIFIRITHVFGICTKTKSCKSYGKKGARVSECERKRYQNEPDGIVWTELGWLIAQNYVPHDDAHTTLTHRFTSSSL